VEKNGGKVGNVRQDAPVVIFVTTPPHQPHRIMPEISTPPRLLNAVPLPELFVGRADLLTRLDAALTVSGRPVLLYGLGGLGKTTVALAYAHSPAAKAAFTHVACFFVNGDLVGAVLDNDALLVSLGQREAVRAARTSGDDALAFTLIVHALQALPGRVLLIFDNVEDTDNLPAFLANFNAERSALLLTSRRELEGTQRLALDELSGAEATELFCRLYYETDVPPAGAVDDPDLRALIDDLDRHTLLVHMVALTGREAGYSTGELARFVRERYIRHDDLQLSVGTGRVGDPDETRRARLHSFVGEIFAELTDLGDADRQWLRWFALLPASPQPFDRLGQLFQLAADADAGLRDGLLRLRRRGLLLEKGGPASGTPKAWSLHRLLRDQVLERLAPDWETSRTVVEAVTGLLAIDPAKDNPIDKFPFLPYGESILAALKPENRSEAADLLGALAWVYAEQGQLGRAIEYSRRALEIDLVLFGEQHERIAMRRSELGRFCGRMGDFKEACTQLEAALAADRQQFGAGERVAVRQANLANVYREMGRHAEARVLLEEALAGELARTGESDPGVAQLRTNLANVYRELGAFVEARDLFERALAAFLQTFGERHPNIAVVRTCLANVHFDLGEREKARDLMEQGLAADLEYLGEDHPNVATHRTNLANVYCTLGDLEKARTLLDVALAAGLRLFGEDHPTVATRRSNLANVYRELGRLDEAQALLEAALDSDRRAGREAHPNVGARRTVLALVLAAKGDFAAARASLQTALLVFEQAFGPNHPNAAAVRGHLQALDQRVQATAGTSPSPGGMN
jgi:tetratricopeptide (TPR) repeat protein